MSEPRAPDLVDDGAHRRPVVPLPGVAVRGLEPAGECLVDLAALDARSVRLEKAVLAASATLRSFAGPPGRRVLMLASGGWPNSPAVWMAGNRTSASFEGEYAWGEELYSPLIETANRLSYTVYPIDVPGSFSFSGTTGAGTGGISAPRGLMSDDAIAEIAARCRDLVDAHGPRCFAYVGGGGQGSLALGQPRHHVVQLDLVGLVLSACMGLGEHAHEVPGVVAP